MKINGEAGPFLRSFFASPDNHPWTLSLRRTDGKEDPAFGKYDKEEVPTVFLQQLIPNWDQLSWREVARPADVATVFPRELTAEAGVYKLNIIAKATSEEPLEEIIGHFLNMMAS